MATIEQYTSGEAAKAVRMAFDIMQNLEESLPGTKYAEVFLKNVNELQPLAVDEEQVFEFIGRASRLATGPRICQCEFPEGPPTAAVFLDDLAVAMVEAGKAEYTTPDKARAALAEHRGKPLVVSKVSGEYREICRTWPEGCFYWNMEKRGLKCLSRLKRSAQE